MKWERTWLRERFLHQFVGFCLLFVFFFLFRLEGVVIFLIFGVEDFVVYVFESFRPFRLDVDLLGGLAVNFGEGIASAECVVCRRLLFPTAFQCLTSFAVNDEFLA